MANAYDVGDLVRISGTFTNAAGTAQDPASVVAKVRDPSNNVATYTYGTDAALVKSATGIYYLDLSADEDGDFWYRFEATGTGASASENFFTVLPSHF